MPRPKRRPPPDQKYDAESAKSLFEKGHAQKCRVAVPGGPGAIVEAETRHDHTGITVPDIKQATDFFVNVLGCKEAMLFSPFADEKGNFMTQLVNVNPRADSWLRKLAKTAVASASRIRAKPH